MLTDAERVAGTAFRESARLTLAEAWRAFPDAAPCDPRLRFFRHQCSARTGRTRSVALAEETETSAEAWVGWKDGALAVLDPDAVRAQVAAGEAVEFEVVLAGKFNFTWRRGTCPKCELRVMSRDGTLREARVRTAPQADLAVLSGTAASPAGIRREVRS